MNAYTRQDLSVMQAWPLERKIRVTQAKIIEWYHHYDGKVAVSFSGGKDSTVLLDLARRAFPDIPAVFVDTGLEYPEIREFVKTVPNVTWLRPEMPFSKVISEYGYPVVSKDVARRVRYAKRGSPWALCHLNGLNRDGTPSKYNERYMKWRILLDAPFFVSDVCCAVMKERPLHRYNRETGRKQIIATMACESARRQSVYLKIGCNAYHKRDPTSQPMSFWTEQDVLEYLRMTGIPYASVYGEIVEKNGRLTTTGAKRTGCMFCMFGVHLEKEPNRFQRMAINWAAARCWTFSAYRMPRTEVNFHEQTLAPAAVYRRGAGSAGTEKGHPKSGQAHEEAGKGRGEDTQENRKEKAARR